MTVNVRKYVEWLLNLPPANLTPAVRDYMPALKTARLLDDLGYLAKAPAVVQSAAFHLWLIPFQFGLGKRPTTRKEALKGLNQFGRFLSDEEFTEAREFIRELTDEQLLRAESRTGRIPNPRSVEYQAPGRVSYRPKIPRKRNPVDDLSDRIWEAQCALKESGCPHANEYIAGVLNERAKRFIDEDWISQNVASRLKAFKGREADAWPDNGWRGWYAFEHPDPKEGSFPEIFEFEPWA